MQDQSSDSHALPADTLNEIGVLKRREIEARIIAPFVEALSQEFGRLRVLEILRRVVVAIAERQGAELADAMGGCSLHHFSDSLENWKKDGALELEVLEESDHKLSFDVKRCRYAELYRALGIPELGEILSCARDYSLTQGFNPEVQLERTNTILGGASHCDFRYRLAKKPVEPPD